VRIGLGFVLFFSFFSKELFLEWCGVKGDHIFGMICFHFF